MEKRSAFLRSSFYHGYQEAGISAHANARCFFLQGGKEIKLLSPVLKAPLGNAFGNYLFSLRERPSDSYYIVTTPLLLSRLLSYIAGLFKVTLKLMRTEHWDKARHQQMRICWYIKHC